MQKRFLSGLVIYLAVCFPWTAMAWDTGLTIYNWSSKTVWITFYYQPGCAKASKSFPNAFAPSAWVDHGWSFDSMCRLNRVEVRQNNSSGTVLGTCTFSQQCTENQCPSSYVTVTYDPRLNNPTYCMTACQQKSYYDTGCWK
ncbi:MAG: hypothetical protein CVU71_04960 [Deltaproteobacteria bacterium HGW-Deltaproteobacteria-6]|jgi:4-amino-4-deoxy-L-arabinose transferase-like glycosyltransferase|nr:MAG: hypothetical protein CVU71_04960 [Deltaproteobacteria bacterium HGW-Deltaproteobacteria-6]